MNYCNIPGVPKKMCISELCALLANGHFLGHPVCIIKSSMYLKYIWEYESNEQSKSEYPHTVLSVFIASVAKLKLKNKGSHQKKILNIVWNLGREREGVPANLAVSFSNLFFMKFTPISQFYVPQKAVKSLGKLDKHH